jgi:uncharacterized protein (TIGR03437 family)
MASRFPLLLLVVLSELSAQTTQTINIVAVANSADFQPGLPQKGSLASLFVTGLQGGSGIITNSTRPLSNYLNGISVWINFLPAPILSIAFSSGYQQINVQFPWEGQRDPLYVEVFQNGMRAHTENTQVNGWSVFFSDANGYGILQHASDYSLVTPQNPAHPGEYVIAYAINLGPVENQPQTGVPASSSPLSYSTTPGGVCRMSDSIHIGTTTGSPSYVGLAPGTVGVYQVNFQLPSSVGTGDLSLTFVRTLLVNPVGQCLGSGLGSQTSTLTSRSVLLPVT